MKYIITTSTYLFVQENLNDFGSDEKEVKPSQIRLNIVNKIDIIKETDKILDVIFADFCIGK